MKTARECGVKGILFRLLLVIGFSLAAMQAQAAVMVTLGQPLVGAGADGLDSTVEDQIVAVVGVERADSFVVTQSMTLTSVEWWGVYDPVVPLVSDNFFLRIFSDAGGLPGGSPVLEYTGLAPLRVDSGLDDILAGDIYHYESAAPAGELLGPGTYWLSVVYLIDPQEPAFWYWSEGTFNDGASAARETGLPWENGANFGNDFDLAFLVNGEVEAGGRIPVPGTLLLMSLAALLGYQRKR